MSRSFASGASAQDQRERADRDALAEALQGSFPDHRDGHRVLGPAGLGGDAAELLEPVAVSPTSTAAIAADGIIRIAKRRHRTLPAVAARAGWAEGVAGVSGDGFPTDMTPPATLVADLRESSVFVFSARSATGVTHPR
jgi:hypothetical protein